MSVDSSSLPQEAATEHEDATSKDTSTAVDGPGRDLTDDHREFLVAHAINPALVEGLGAVRSLVELDDLPEDRDATWPSYVPTLLYRWKMGERETLQIRIPEKKRSDGGPKYLFPKNAEPPLNQINDDGHGPILLVEGTNQHLAAASNAPIEYSVYGMSGCWGWAKADPSFMAKRLVYVIFDADLKNNRDVWNAARELQAAAKAVKAIEVRFVLVPGPGKDGLDDFLAKITDDDQRRDAMATLIEDAVPTLPKAPAKKKNDGGPASAYFGDHGKIKAMTVAKALVATLPMALTVENRVAVYRDGVYRTNDLALVGALVQMLKDDYSRGYLGTIEDTVMGVLDIAGFRLPDHIDRPWLNTLDGMVDLETGEEHDHDPDLMSAVQFPVHYDPAATCPTFDRWAAEIIGDQLPALLEAASVMLDPTKTPQKALLLYGPARSGKSTFLRLLEAIAGIENRSGVSLHDLADDQFAAANLYGKALNVSADLSARHVQDISRFKLMTGEDTIRGNRKYGKDFHFRATALFAFSANEIPTVGEASRAYVERMLPFKFSRSFAGRVDPSIEQAMMGELSGILNRLVAAYQARSERGHDLSLDPAILAEFEQASDRVQMWLAEEMAVIVSYGDTAEESKKVVPGMTVPPECGRTAKGLYELFSEWSADNGGGRMGKGKFVQRLAQVQGVVEVRIGKAKLRGFNVVVPSPVAEMAKVATIPETSSESDSRTSDVTQRRFSRELPQLPLLPPTIPARSAAG